MTKVTYKLIEHDGRYYFNDGTGHFLIDTGYGNVSVSRDGTIGPFATATREVEDFLGTSRPEGQKAKGILAPMEGYSVLLKGDTVTIDNDAQELPAHDYFIPFVSARNPIIEGKCNGKPMRFFFDSGMRMAVLDDTVLKESKPCLGTMKEWIGALHIQVEAPYYSAEYEFSDGLRFDGHGEYDFSGSFVKSIRLLYNNEFDNFFGIELFKKYDIFISLIPGKQGIAVIRRD